MAKFKWTICVVMQIDEDAEIEGKYKEFIGFIEKQQPNPAVRYVVLEYRNTIAAGQVIKINKLVKATNADTFTSSDLDNNQHDLYAPATLVDFFNNHVLDEESDSHMLITWGHGAGLGFFAEKITNPIRAMALETIAGSADVDDFIDYSLSELMLRANGYARLIKEPLENNLQSFAKRNNLFGVEAQRSAFLESSTVSELFRYRLIPIHEFAAILRQTFGVKQVKLDIMFTLNCYLQMFETGFTLKDHVNILVSPVTVIPFKGIDYDHLFKTFNEAPDTGAEVIARDIVLRYPGVHAGDPAFNSERYKLSANKLSHYEVIQKRIDLFCSFYELGFVEGASYRSLITGQEKKLNGFIQLTRRQCEDHTKGDDKHFVAVADFFNKFRVQFSGLMPLDSGVIVNAGTVFQMVRDSIIQSFPPVSDPSVEQVLPFMSIFFPDKRDSAEHHVKFFLDTIFNNEATPFTSQSLWDNFVRRYITRL